MPTVAVIPVKSFRNGKQRLAGALGPDGRAAVGRAMAGHVAETAASAGLIPLVVTPDHEVAAWAAAEGFPSISDPAQGLDIAAAAGVVWAVHADSSWLVLHADLPLLEPADLEKMERFRKDGLDPIAPSADGGTSAMGSKGEVGFAFGPGSFRRHLAALVKPGILTSTGLLHDVDSPQDLASALSHPRGSWMERHL